MLKRAGRDRFFAAVLLGIHAALLVWSAHVHSPTFNEPGHLAGGISIWRLERFDVYQVNPPLVRAMAAAPVLVAGAKTDWRRFCEGPGIRAESSLGADFVAANGARSFTLFTLARLACIPLSLLGACLAFCWARELYGYRAGLLALALWCFCPNILAHGHLITPDAAAAALGLAAGYAFWRWLARPTWPRALVSGLVWGAAELSKTTLLVFYPLWPLLWLVYRWSDRREMRRRHWLRELGMLSVQFVLSAYLINLGYGFQGTGTPLGEYRFVSAALGARGGADKAPYEGGNRFAGQWLGNLPVPLPKDYLLGIDLQKRDFEDYHKLSYLRGQFRSKGWWYYYFYALAIKVPLGTWLLLGLAALVRWWVPVSVRLRDEFVVLMPAVVILGLVSSESGFSQHMRYVLPAFPFVFVWIGRMAVVLDGRHRVLAGLTSAALAWSILSSLWVYPHSLSYFNELAGGPRGGPAHLVHSNVDWGQDLLILKGWLDDHPEARPLKLAYFGDFDPRHAGIEYTAPDDLTLQPRRNGSKVQIPPGWYAISVNFVRGYPDFVFRGDGSSTSLSQNALAAFQRIAPTAMAGYSIYIYHIPNAACSVKPKGLGIGD